MKVTVKLHGVLRRHRPDNLPGQRHQPFELELTEDGHLAELKSKLMIDEGMVAGIAVNGEAVRDDEILQEGDEINLFPPVSGG